jgi:hypothetical protein
MLEKTIAALLGAALLASSAFAQQPKPALSYETPVKSELDQVLGRLVEQAKTADGIAARLREAISAKPQDMRTPVDEAAANLSKLADSLTANGELGSKMVALHGAALLHFKRVQEMKDAISEQDRMALVETWQNIIQTADNAQAAMGEMRGKLADVLQKLRMRQVAISEFMLAGRYEAAIAAVSNWLNDLQATVNSLHQAIDQIGPTRLKEPQS